MGGVHIEFTVARGPRVVKKSALGGIFTSQDCALDLDWKPSSTLAWLVDCEREMTNGFAMLGAQAALGARSGPAEFQASCC
jgi:hypothetical protein